MKKIVKKISRAVQVLLAAPIKLPGKAMHVIRYIAVGLGIIETVWDKEADKPVETERKQAQDADDE